MIQGFDLDAFVTATLAEDLGPGGDITSAAVIPVEARFVGTMASRDAITVAGLPIADAFFRRLDPDVVIERLVEDGASVPAGTELLRLSGQARAMLTAERSALNTVQHLSGIATMTAAYVAAIAGTGATLLDTRKTIPGLRLLEKYATRMGGAQNHRMGLVHCRDVVQVAAAPLQQPKVFLSQNGFADLSHECSLFCRKECIRFRLIIAPSASPGGNGIVVVFRSIHIQAVIGKTVEFEIVATDFRTVPHQAFDQVLELVEGPVLDAQIPPGAVEGNLDLGAKLV